MNGHEPQWLRDLDEFISTRQAQLDQLRTSLEAVRGMFSGAIPMDKAILSPGLTPIGNHRRAPLTAGALPDRLLSIAKDAGGPVKLGDFRKGAKAQLGDVKAAIKQLVADGRLKQTGVRAGTRYEVRS